MSVTVEHVMTLAGWACICMCLWWCQSSGSQSAGSCDPQWELDLLYLSILKRPHTAFMHTHHLSYNSPKLRKSHWNTHKHNLHTYFCTNILTSVPLKWNSHTQTCSERNWKWEEAPTKINNPTTHTHCLLLFTTLQIFWQDQALKTLR